MMSVSTNEPSVSPQTRFFQSESTTTVLDVSSMMSKSTNEPSVSPQTRFFQSESSTLIDVSSVSLNAPVSNYI